MANNTILACGAEFPTGCAAGYSCSASCSANSMDAVTAIYTFGSLLVLILMSGMFSGLTLGLMGLDPTLLEIVARAGEFWGEGESCVTRGHSPSGWLVLESSMRCQDGASFAPAIYCTVLQASHSLEVTIPSFCLSLSLSPPPPSLSPLCPPLKSIGPLALSGTLNSLTR